MAHQRHMMWWTNKRNTSQELLTSGQADDVSLRRIFRKLGRQQTKFHAKHLPRTPWGILFYIFYITQSLNM